MTGSNELLIIGAGPSGLSLAHHYPGPTRILERESEVGGLCRSFELGGGVFDIGGHSFHTPHAAVDGLVRGLMTGKWNEQKRDARVYFNGEFIPYPFQQNFGRLANRAVVEDCLARGPSATGNPANFEDWIIARFGGGVAEHFMLPYNRKLWACDLTRMSCDWVGERVAGSAQSSGKGKRQPLQSHSMVGYPAAGGFGEIFKAMAKECGLIEFNCDAARISIAKKTVESADGRVWTWKQLASTMPVPLFLDRIDDVPVRLRERVSQLEAVALRILMILVADPLPSAPQRVYLCDPAIPPHKVAFNHTSSPELRRRPVHAIMCEISHSAAKPLPADADLERATTDWLIDAGLVPKRGDIALIRHFEAAFGYPVYTHARPAIMAEIRAWLVANDISTFGRFGGWDYANSDECIRQGMDLAGELSRLRSPRSAGGTPNAL